MTVRDLRKHHRKLSIIFLATFSMESANIVKKLKIPKDVKSVMAILLNDVKNVKIVKCCLITAGNMKTIWRCNCYLEYVRVIINYFIFNFHDCDNEVSLTYNKLASGFPVAFDYCENYPQKVVADKRNMCCGLCIELRVLCD